MKQETEIKNVGGSVGYDEEGNTYTREAELDQNNNRIWGKWIKNNKLGCSGRTMNHYEEQNKKYNEIQKICGVQ